MKDQLSKIIKEAISLDIDIGDEILTGRFKNKKTIVKTIDKDDKNQPTINGKTILKFRIKKLIKEEIDKIFEAMEFQAADTAQLATNMSLFKLPRKGIDDSINNYNVVQSEMDKIASEEEREKKMDDKFNSPTLAPNAVVSTNIYESEEKDIAESYGIYGSTAAAQQNLDWDRGISPTTSNFNKDSQEEIDLYNDNINRALSEIPPGNARQGTVSNNKSKNF